MEIIVSFINNYDGYLSYEDLIFFVCSKGLYNLYMSCDEFFILLLNNHNEGVYYAEI